MVKMVDDKVNEIESDGDDFEKRVLNDSGKYVKYLTVGFWICAMITANLMCVNSFIQSFIYEPTVELRDSVNVTSFPPVILRSWFPFEDQWEHFNYVYWTQFYIMWLGMIIVPCQHVFIVGIMIYLITALKILLHKLENLKEDSGKDYNTELVQCLHKQLHIKELAKELEDLMSHALFLDFVIFSVLLCALLFQISKVFWYFLSFLN